MTTDTAFTIFSTALGSCAIAWAESGVLAVELPADDRGVRARLQRRFPRAVESEPTPEIARAIDGIIALLGGDRRDLADVVVDMTSVAPFDQRVLEAARTIPPGETLTYGQLAAQIGHAGAARDVGAALGRNPFPIVVPCHRILAAGGKAGGFSGTGGVATKLKLLAIERSAGPLFDGVLG